MQSATRLREMSELEYIDPPQNPPQPLYYRPCSSEEEYYSDSSFDSVDSPPESDSDSDELFVATKEEIDPMILAAAPAALFTRRPIPPRPGNSWYCPVPGCSHEIDLYNLPDDHPNLRKALPDQTDIDFVREGEWSLASPELLYCFERLVSVHCDDHLEALGVEEIDTGKKVGDEVSSREENHSNICRVSISGSILQNIYRNMRGSL